MISSRLARPARVVRLVRVVLAAAAVVALAACSTGDDEGAATTTTSTSLAPLPSTPTTPVPDYEGDPDSPFCTLLRDIDPSAILSGDGDDPAAVRDAIGRLVAVLADAAEAAPPEIVEDVALVGGGVAALDEALAAVDYDFDALAAAGDAEEVAAAMNDPAFADAGVRLGAYRSQVCQL